MTRNDTQGGALAEPEARRDTAAPNRKGVLQRQRDEFGGFQWGTPNPFSVAADASLARRSSPQASDDD